MRRDRRGNREREWDEFLPDYDHDEGMDLATADTAWARWLGWLGTLSAIAARPLSAPLPRLDDEAAPVEPLDTRLPAVMPNGPSVAPFLSRERQAA